MEEIVDESFFLNELLEDDKNKSSGEQTENQLKDNFGFKQIGSVTKYVEPVNSSNPFNYILEKFQEDENLMAIPIEQDDQIIGLVERSSVEKLLTKKLGLFSNAKIIDYVKYSEVTVFARDYIEKTLSKISSIAYRNNLQYFPVMYNSQSFYGIVSLEDFLQRVAEIRDKDLEKAQLIQQYILPESSNSNVKVGIWNRMANAVGGDVYVHKNLTEDLSVIASFDVSGKNVAAALLTMFIGAFFSSEKMYKSENLEPCSITAELDDFLEKLVPMGNFITGTLCYIDQKNQKIEIHNCGHTTAYLFIPNFEIKKISIVSVNAAFPPFGMGAIKSELKNQKKKIFTCPVSKGIHINLFSDGFTDMQNEGSIRFEEERAKAFFIQLYKKKWEEMETFTQSTVENWIENAMLPDDITVMDIRL